MTWHPAATRGRWYRGQHRHGAWRVHVLNLAILAGEQERRRAHLRSLRRHTSPGPVYVGSHLLNVRFYGVAEEPMAGTLTLVAPDGAITTLPAIEQVLHEQAHQPAADEAPTGPIFIEGKSA